MPLFADSPVDPEVAEATAGFADRLAQTGTEVITGDLFFHLDAANHIWRVISRAGVAFLMG